MKVGIIGAGKVGSTIGKKLALKGHQITFGVRNSEKYKDLTSLDNIQIKTVKETGQLLDILILAVPGLLAMEILAKLGDISNKLILDTTNMTHMSELMKISPKTSFIKFLNTMGYNIMDNPFFGDIKADTYLCGDNQQGLDIAAQLANDLDLNPIIVGDSSLSEDLENLAILWIKLSRKLGRNISFKLLFRD